jgi:hypothetical protein
MSDCSNLINSAVSAINNIQCDIVQIDKNIKILQEEFEYLNVPVYVHRVQNDSITIDAENNVSYLIDENYDLPTSGLRDGLLKVIIDNMEATSSNMNSGNAYIPTLTNSNITIYSIAYIPSTNTVYLAGSFSVIQQKFNTSLPANNIVAYNLVTKTFSRIGLAGSNGTNDTIKTLCYKNINLGTGVKPYLFVGGAFTSITNFDGSTVAANRVAYADVTNPSAITWNVLGTLANNGLTSANAVANTIDVITSTRNIYVGGTFSQTSDNTNNAYGLYNVAYFNLTPNRWYPLGSGAGAANNGTSATVNSLVANGINVYVTGNFTTVNDGAPTIANYIGRWLDGGATWTAVTTGLNNPVFKVIKDNTTNILYMIGSFTVADPFGANLSANHVVSYVIGSNTWIALGSQSSNDNGLTNIGPLSDIILFTDATSNKYLYIQGNNITSALNTNNYKSFLNSVNLVRWSITNSTWEGIGGNNSLYGMLAIDTSRLMIGTFIFIPSNIITVSNTNPQTILYNGVDYNEIQFNNVGSTISLVWSSALNKWVINAIPVPLLTAITPVS